MSAALPSVAVFTVKRFIRCRGEYWTYGGFGDYVKSLLPHFSKVILACHPVESADVPSGWYRLADPKLEIVWLPYYEKEHQCLMKLPAMLMQCRAIAQRADMINARVPDYTGICGAYWARRFAKPLFINHVDDWHSRVADPVTGRRGLVKQGLRAHYALYCWCEKRVCRDALLFAQGDFAAQLYASNRRSYRCLSSSHYDADVIEESRALRPLPPDKLRILTVGRHVFVKGHVDLIRAIAAISSASHPRQVQLTIAGQGPMTSEYRRLARELGIEDRIRIVGQVDREGIFALYDQADVFCLPSLSEGTPKVLLEAMARGVPVVACDVGGVSTVVKGEQTGLLVSPSRPDALASAICRLVADDALRQRCVRNGLAVARAHTVEREWGRMMSIVRQHYPELWR